MTLKLLDTDQFREAVKDGNQPDAIVYRFATAEPQNVDGAVRTKRFVFSDATVDHAGDSIDPKGWDLSVFNKNPVALWSHDSFSPPIGRAANVGVEKGKLVGDIEFAPPEVSDFADSIYRLVDGGYLKAVSVGFRPKEWSFSKDKDRPYGIDFKSQILLEISVCSVPCNPSALEEARSAGIDTAPLREWAEKVLDSGDVVFLPKTELETLRKQADEKAPVQYFLQMPADMAAKLAVASGEKSVNEAHVEAKAGRRVSAATRAKIMESIDMHHAAIACCMKALDDGDGPDPEDDTDNDEPAGTVIPQKTDDLTPEEKRLKEVAELKAALPKNT